MPLLKGTKVCVHVGEAALLKQLLYQCVSPPVKKMLRWINKQAHTIAINNYWAAPQPCTLWRHLKIKCFLHFVHLCLILLWPVWISESIAYSEVFCLFFLSCSGWPHLVVYMDMLLYGIWPQIHFPSTHSSHLEAKDRMRCLWRCCCLRGEVSLNGMCLRRG